MADPTSDLLIRLSQKARAAAVAARDNATLAQLHSQRAREEAQKMLAGWRTSMTDDSPHHVNDAVGHDVAASSSSEPAQRTADETPVATARRHVAEAEQHVAHLRRIIEELVQDNHPAQAVMAHRVLHTLEDSLRLAQDHLAREEIQAGEAGKR